MKISCIAACTQNNVIGNNGRIPWFITGEQKRFKELTTGHVVIMGRKTFAEIAAKLGGPLPNRKTIVLSQSMNQSSVSDNPESSGVWYASSVDQALAVASKIVSSPSEEIFIAGGESLYRAFINLSDTLYLTEIDAVIPGDTFFPEFNRNEWSRQVISEHHAEFNYRYVTWSRIKQ